MERTRADRATEEFAANCNCAQAVLASFSEDLGMGEGLARRIASTLGGGLGMTGTTCGAAAGALLVLGLRHGASDGGDRETKERGYAAAQEFLRRFEARCGARDCRTLTGHDLSDPEDRERAREEGVFRERCPRFVRAACEILEEME